MKKALLRAFFRVVYIGWGLTLLLVTLACCVASLTALGFPENARLGYATGCTGCHLSPSGGGALTTYGRSTAEELSTFRWEKSGQIFGALEQPEWLALGGDGRHVLIQTPYFRRQFWMQNDLELGLRLSPEVWLAGSAGVYGPERVAEYRRHYLLWVPGRNVSVRLGRFTEAYGLGLPDHTSATRRPLGFNEGQETVNAELRVHGDLGEVFLTGLFGKEGEVSFKGDEYRGKARDSGVSLRASAALGSKFQVGGSYRYLVDTERAENTFGAFLSGGLTRDLYLLSEVDRLLSYSIGGSPPTHQDVSYTELGYEVFRGIHLLSTYEFERSTRYGYGLTWYPLPHVEISGRAKHQDGLWQSLLLTHLYF